MLEARGLLSKPRGRTGTPKPSNKSMLGRILRNRYYTGKVHFKGAYFDGNHDPLVSQTLFDQVQDTLEHKNLAGVRKRTHDHFLKGGLTCEHCKAPVFYTVTKNRHGSIYSYFFCQGRRDGFCDLPYLQEARVTYKVEQAYQTTKRLTPESVERLNAYITAEIELL